MMANADIIRKALMALMREKQSNARGIANSKRGPDPTIKGDIENTQEMIDFDTRIGNSQLRQAREDARQVQGTDPLAISNREFQGSEASGRFPDQPVKRGGLNKNPARLPDAAIQDPPSIPGRFSDEAGMRQAENLAEDAMWGGVDPDATMANLIANDIRRKGLDNLDPADLLELDAFAGKGASRALIKEMFADQQVNNPLTTADDIPF